MSDPAMCNYGFSKIIRANFESSKILFIYLFLAISPMFFSIWIHAYVSCNIHMKNNGPIKSLLAWSA